MKAKNQHKGTHRDSILLGIAKWLLRLSAGLILLMVISLCSMFTYYLRYDIAGHITERMIRYPDSELLWSGSEDSCCSAEYGTNHHYRWTSHDEATVNAYYSEATQRIIIVQPKDLTFDGVEGLCTYHAGSSVGCETVKRLLPSYGTVIIFTHDTWTP